MYDGPIIDAFLHTPWLGGDDPVNPRGDRMDWSGDRRLQRVMHTFKRNDAHGKPAAAVQKEVLFGEMMLAGVERAVLPAKIYYPTPEAGVLALLILMLLVVGMFLDGVSIFLIFIPLLMPIAMFYKWDVVCSASS